ncbi:hypothetical protein PAHAL_5G093800 [Panicum hallii]|uniref:Uncharacterized protein n=1 Tax=Panicum hallii TaxID=206008 RepID=A0A2T8IJF3_9POAL|nr:hypothetical protein PAHAL_5G093800 [Panicum hallii]
MTRSRSARARERVNLAIHGETVPVISVGVSPVRAVMARQVSLRPCKNYF